MFNIYLIGAIIDENIIQWKIGISIHPDKRLLQLKTSNPNIDKIYALYKIKDRELAYKTEALLKRKLKQFKINGEWIDHYGLNVDLFLLYCEMCETSASVIIENNNNRK